MSPADPHDPWASLADSLGANPAAEPPAARPATPAPAPKPPRPAAPRGESKPVTPPKSDWGDLASSLGLEPAAAPAPPRPAAPAADSNIDRPVAPRRPEREADEFSFETRRPAAEAPPRRREPVEPQAPRARELDRGERFDRDRADRDRADHADRGDRMDRAEQSGRADGDRLATGEGRAATGGVREGTEGDRPAADRPTTDRAEGDRGEGRGRRRRGRRGGRGRGRGEGRREEGRDRPLPQRLDGEGTDRWIGASEGHDAFDDEPRDTERDESPRRDAVRQEGLRDAPGGAEFPRRSRDDATAGTDGGLGTADADREGDRPGEPSAAGEDGEGAPRRRRRRGRRGGRRRGRGTREGEVGVGGDDGGAPREGSIGGQEAGDRDLDDEPLPTGYGSRPRPSGTSRTAGSGTAEGAAGGGAGGEKRDEESSGRRRRRRRGEGRSRDARRPATEAGRSESGSGRRGRSRRGDERRGSTSFARGRRDEFAPVAGGRDEDDEGLEFLGLEDAGHDGPTRLDRSTAENDEILAESGLSNVLDVPSWVEAIGIVIAGNLDARTRSPRGGDGSGRGNSGDRGREGRRGGRPGDQH